MEAGAARVKALSADDRRRLRDATNDEFLRYDIVQQNIVERLIIDPDRAKYESFCLCFAQLETAIRRQHPSRPSQQAASIGELFAHAAAVKPTFDKVNSDSNCW